MSLRWVVPVVVAGGLLALPKIARAEALQAPVSGKPIPIGEGRVACPGLSGWTIEGEGKLVRPPAGDDAIGSATEVKVAANSAACATTTTTATLVATARVPSIDPLGATLAVDDGRLDVRGKRLKGARFEWTAGKTSGADTCTDPKVEGTGETCGLALPRELPADAKAISIRVLPAGGRLDAITFDADGKRVPLDAQAVVITRIIVTRLLPSGAAVDVTTGATKIPLAHPEVLTSVDCVGASCDLSGGNLVVADVTTAGDKLVVKAHLAPHVFLRKGDALDATPTMTLALLHCPMVVASGPPLANVDDVRGVVRLDGACGASAASLRYQVDGAPAPIVRVVKDKDATYVVLRLGRLGPDPIVVQALRALPDSSVVASARTPTAQAPRPHATLRIEGVGPIDFVPTNRPAIVELPPLDGGKLVTLPVEGAYEVTSTPALTTIRGTSKAAGFVSLHYALRSPALPGALATEDLAQLVDPIAFAIREANVPASIGASALGAKPIVELVCDVPGEGPLVIAPGALTHVPFGARDSCRFVFHRERVPVEDGAQKLTLEIDVMRVDGASRPESHVREELLLRPGNEQKLAWIKGVGGEFDRVTVRLTHSGDESHYVGRDLDVGAPSAQWSVVMGTGKARIYATTAIPTGLYRVSDKAHSGILALNFGVLSRLTWLDTDGHEGVLGLEAGVMGVGLARDTSASGESLTQVAVVTGLGISVPIANRSLATEASINLHAWLEYEVSRAWGGYPGNPLAFVFGPSISIGNIGTNL